MPSDQLERDLAVAALRFYRQAIWLALCQFDTPLHNRNPELEAVAREQLRHALRAVEGIVGSIEE